MKIKYVYLILFFFIIGCNDENRNNISKDWRDKYIGNYIFNIQEISYIRTEPEPNNIITEFDTISYMFQGQITKYKSNKLLVHYSENSPLLGCENKINNNSTVLCEGDSLSECIQNCSDSNKSFLRYMIALEILPDGALSMNEIYYRIYGEGIMKGNDSIYFNLAYPEKMFGWEDIIIGKKIE